MLKIGGFTPLSTTDWPGQLAAVVFVQGCPWRCHYCHNVELQTREGGLPGGWLQVLGTLSRRHGLLDGVVFSGGEPTLDPDLLDAMQTVRSMGFKVGLHTAGVYPERLEAVLPHIDWVGFDVKTDFADYEEVTGIPRSGPPAWRSLSAVLYAAKHLGLEMEVRTTWHPQLHHDDKLVLLAQSLVKLGVSHWVLQSFRNAHIQTEDHMALNETWAPPSEALLQRIRDNGLRLEVR